MRTTTLLNKAAKFIEDNDLKLYVITVNPDLECAGSTKISLQGHLKDNKSFYNKNKLPFVEDDGFLIGRFDGITVNLGIG